MQRGYRRMALVLSIIFLQAGAGAGLVRAQAPPEGIPFAWGENDYGELGNGNVTGWPYYGIATPASVSGLSHIVAIAGGNAHSLALDRYGTVWAWGNNPYGQLGNGTFTGDPYDAIAIPAPVINLSNIVAIAAGGNHSLALRSDGTVWAWGYNY